MSDREPIVAYDYTPIIKHRGKQFTVGDMSLSKFGGIDLSAAATALAPALVVGFVIAVLLWLTSPAVFWAALPTAAVWTGFYLWFSREQIDAQAPLDRIFLAVSARRTQPVRLGGSNMIGVRKSGPWHAATDWMRSGPIGRQIGTRHRSEDRHPDVLRFVVIVKRPADPAHLTLGVPLAGRQQYSPRPKGAGQIIDDDFDRFGDWYAYLDSYAAQQP